MSKTDSHVPPVKPGDKVVRACPDNELKEPRLRFEDTFSAETVVLKTVFPKD